MTREEKLKLAAEIRAGGMPVVIPEEYLAYRERVDQTERWIDTSEGPAHVYVLREKGKTGVQPLYINIHGGGFTRPHKVQDLVFSSRMCCEADCVVIDVDYRLAPEYPYPAAVNECYDLVGWVIAHAGEFGIDPERVVVGGHSSGAALTAALLLKANQSGAFRVRMQILDYPPLDVCTDPAEKLHRQGLDGDVTVDRAYNAMYVDAEQASEPYASPVFATEEMMRGLPEAVIITAGKDMLRFEAADYAEKLRAAGVKTELRCFENSDHGFTNCCRDEYREAQQLYIDSLRRAFAE